MSSLKLSSQELIPGVVEEMVVCEQTLEQSYSIYLPKSYHSEKSWPMVLFFEPLARKALPLKKYQSLADEYGYIFLSSNNSKNGPLVVGEKAYKAIMDDVQNRLEISIDFIVTSGFSGGGRFALHMALTYPEVDAVISCAGPKPVYVNEETTFPSELLYAGLVGNLDMNYVEHLQFRDALNDRDIENCFFMDTVGHQWPAEQSFKHALEWLQVQRSKTEEVIEGYVKKRLQFIHKKCESNIVVASYLLDDLRRTVDSEEFLKNEDLASIDKKLLDSKAIIGNHYKIIKTESGEQKEYLKAMEAYRSLVLNPNLTASETIYNQKWWTKVIKKIKKMEADEDRLLAESGIRSTDFLRGIYYEYFAYAMSYNRYEFAAKVNELNIQLYPELAWYRWNQAVVEALKGNKKSAQKQLEVGMELDVVSIIRFQNLQRFEYLKKDYPWLFSINN